MRNDKFIYFHVHQDNKGRIRGKTALAQKKRTKDCTHPIFRNVAKKTKENTIKLDGHHRMVIIQMIITISKMFTIYRILNIALIITIPTTLTTTNSTMTFYFTSVHI